MSKYPQALYRMPGAEKHELGPVTTVLVHNKDQLDKHLEEGWHETAEDAKATFDLEEEAKRKPADAEDDAPPTRAELEQKAAELGVKVDGRTSDKKLADAIDAALKACNEPHEGLAGQSGL